MLLAGRPHRLGHPGTTRHALLRDKISTAAWRSKPASYIVAANDQTIPPEVERGSAKRRGADMLVLKSSHVPMLSLPHEVAEFIAKAAAAP